MVALDPALRSPSIRYPDPLSFPLFFLSLAFSLTLGVEDGRKIWARVSSCEGSESVEFDDFVEGLDPI